MCVNTTWFLRSIRAFGLLSVYIYGQNYVHAQHSISVKNDVSVKLERNSIVGLSSGKEPAPVVIDLLRQLDESRLLATVTIMHTSYWQDHAIIAAVTEQLPHWNDEKPEVYLAVMQKITQNLSKTESFATIWLGLQSTPLLLRDIAFGLMCYQSKTKIDSIRQMLLATDGMKSQAIIEDAAADASSMAIRSFDQEKMLTLLKLGGLYQKKAVLLYLDSNWPIDMEPDLFVEIKGIAENSPNKSIALLAGSLLSKHAKM